MINHYIYLDEYFIKFLTSLGIKDPEEHRSLIAAQGDKCYGYAAAWEEAHIPFYEGVAIYLLTHISPWNTEVRETPEGWTAPHQWVIDNYLRFGSHFMSPGGPNDL